MKKESIIEQWKPYEMLISSKAVQDILNGPQNYLDEDIIHIIPNIELAADGPVVRGLVFVTDFYLGEVHFLKKPQEHFDFSPLKSIINYRVELGVHEVVTNSADIDSAKKSGKALPAPQKIIYQKAEITLTHAPNDLATTINYVGEDRINWLKALKKALPSSILKP